MGHSSDMATDDRKARRYYGAFSRVRGLRRRRGFREDNREGRSLAGGRHDLDRAAVGADEFGPIGVHAPLTLIGSSVPSAASNARLQLVARRLRRLGSRHPLGFLLASASQQDDHE